jgi:general stress protein YciG
MKATTGSTGTHNRGFASMDAAKQREIARKGGRAAHEKGTAHEFTTDEARAAGRKGGERVSANREHMSRIGRMGGKISAGRRQQGASLGSAEGSNDGNVAEPGQMAGATMRPEPEMDRGMPPAGNVG